MWRIAIERFLQFHASVLVDFNERLMLGSKNRVNNVLIRISVLDVRVVRHDIRDAF